MVWQETFVSFLYEVYEWKTYACVMEMSWWCVLNEKFSYKPSMNGQQSMNIVYCAEFLLYGNT